MFSYLRSKMKVVFIIVAVAFLITIFAFWGMDVDSQQYQKAVAFSVDGEDISIRNYEETVSRYLDQYRGQDVTEELRRMVRKRAADDLIGQKILEAMSKKMGIYVTKEELKGHVHNEFPNEQVYQDYLRRAPSSWWQMLEESTDKRILISRARAPIMDAVWVSDSEWIRIISDLYWEADLSHILFSPAAEVTDSDVFDFYTAHRHKILEQAKVQTRQILFKFSADDPETDVVSAVSRAVRVLELAKAGKDFAALARKYSDAPDAEDGGDMGFYKAGDMVKEIDDVAFAMNPGQVFDTFIRTEFGYHILKLEERIPASIRPFTPLLAEEIRPAAVTDTHWEDAKARAERVLETVKKFPEQFPLLAKLNSQATSRKNGGRLGWVPRLLFPSGYEYKDLIGEVTQGAAVEREIGKAAFETPINSVDTELVRTSLGWHILLVNGRRAITGAPPSDTDIRIVRSTYSRLLGEEAIERWIQEERKKIKIKFNIDIEG